jgi:hypothetical protein
LKKIIHIASDEKFINSAYSQFEEVYRGENLFYIIVDNIDKPLIHVNLMADMVLISCSTRKIEELPQLFTDAKVICFHGMGSNNSTVILNTPSKYKKVWFLWGFEIYNNPLIFRITTITGAKTFDLYYVGSTSNRLLKILKTKYRKLNIAISAVLNPNNRKMVSALKCADYCAVLYKEEFNIVRRKLGNSIDYINFSYYPVEKMLLNVNIYVNADNILLGNSASFTNNHIEIFEILKNFDLKKKQIVTPLSYGSEKYQQQILAVGQKLFNENFEPMVDFIPKGEYFKVLQKCGIVIMNHYRQQAVGNVMMMLWMGAKVFLDERNSVFHYLKRINISVFSIQNDLNIENPEVFILLDSTIQKRNREILKSQIGEGVLKQNLESQFDLLLNEH